MMVSRARLRISRRLIRRARGLVGISKAGRRDGGIGTAATVGGGTGADAGRESEVPSMFMRLVSDMTLLLSATGGGEVTGTVGTGTGVVGIGCSRIGPISLQIAAYVSPSKSSMDAKLMRLAFSFLSSAVSRNTSCSGCFVLGELVHASIS